MSVVKTRDICTYYKETKHSRAIMVMIEGCAVGGKK